MINPSILSKTKQFAAEFSRPRPFKHVVIDDFLIDSVCESLLSDFPDFETRFAVDEHGRVGGKAARTDVRDISAAYGRVDDHIRSGAFLDFMSQITGIPDLLYDVDYIGGGTHENRNGQNLDPHVDFNYHPRTGWHRRLNLIVYLNREWNEGWGGALQLHSDPWDSDGDDVTVVAPIFNRCVVFETTESSWHGFSTISLPEDRAISSRKSFAIYLYTRERRPEESFPPHATIYVPQGAPGDLRAGHELTDADLRRLKGTFLRARDQIRFLYAREMNFGAQIAALETELKQARESFRFPLQGYASQSGGATGLWPDGWAGSELFFGFVPNRNVKELRLRLWAPTEIGKDLSLSIDVDGRTFTQTMQPRSKTDVCLPLRVPVGTSVSVKITSSRTWVPMSGGASGDARALAFKVIEAALVH